MTVLAATDEYYAEYERCIGTGHGGLLTIARSLDGHCVGMTGKAICRDFKDCLNKHGAEKTIATYLRIAQSMGIGWEPLYKARAVPAMIAEFRKGGKNA